MWGGGIIRGLIETGRNFIGSYFSSKRLTTVQYPEEKLPPQENARTIPFLVYDGEDPARGLRCTACTICEQECPAQCIFIVKDMAKKADYLGKMQLQPRVFDIDVAVCMGCGICAEVCPFDSIKMDTTFSLATTDRFASLLLHKEQLAKPNEYFRAIHLGQAIEVDLQRAEEKHKAELKARAAAAPKPAPVPVKAVEPVRTEAVR